MALDSLGAAGVAGSANGLGVAPLGGFRSDVQALRGLAVLVVVLYHAQIVLPGGFVGVDVFFVISGFVIGRLLLAQFTSTGAVSFRSFYVRRARRLLPALGVMLALVVIAAPLLAPRDAVEVTSRTGIAAALFSANACLYRATAVGYFGTVAELNPLLHTWSLSVEEQFYFVMPVLLWLAWRLGRRAGRPLLALRLFIIGLFSVSFVACLVFSFAGSVGPIDGLRFAFFSPVTRAWEFAVGLGLVVLPLRWSVSPRLRAAFIVIGLGLIGVATLLYTDSTVFPGVAALLPVLGAALVIYGGTSSTGEERGSRTRAALRPMVRLGDLSYSWYLWHWPMIVFAGAFWPNAGRLPLVAAAAFSLFPAWISYRTLEQRLRATSRTRTWPTVALAGCCIAAPLVAAVVARPITASISRQPAIGRFADGGEPHQDEVAGCEDETPLGDRAPDACIRGNLTSDTSVLLIGDSNAGHFSETLIGAAESTSARLQIATLNSCPFIDAIVELDANLGSGPEASGVCREFVLRAVEDLESQQPDVVVIANATIEPRHVVGIECDARCGQLSSWSWSGSVSRGWLSSAIEVSER